MKRFYYELRPDGKWYVIDRLGIFNDYPGSTLVGPYMLRTSDTGVADTICEALNARYQ